MRIALYHNLPSGGAKRAVYEWVRRLAAEHAIDVYTLSSFDHDFCDIRPFVQMYNIYHFDQRRLLNSPFGRLNQLQRWLDLGDLQRLSRQVASEINLVGYDVLFANTDIYTFIPALLAYTRIPSVYYLHEPFGQNFTRPIDRPYLKHSRKREIMDRYDPFIYLFRRRLTTIQNLSLKRTKLLLANSQFTRQQMKLGFHVDTPVSPYGVNSNNFHPVPHITKENFIISVGELSPRKGFDFLIESLSNIPFHQRPKLRLASNMVDSLEKDYLEDLAGQRGVELETLINLTSDELTIQYNKALLCAYAPVMEPFGLVPLEAMACGTPVIGVCEGGVKESIVHGYTGILVDRNTTHFSDAIQHLISNPELAANYGRNGRDHVLQNWTWDRSVERLVEYLQRAVSTHANQPKVQPSTNYSCP